MGTWPWGHRKHPQLLATGPFPSAPGKAAPAGPGAPHVSITTWDQQLPWEDLALEFPLIVNVSAYLSLLGIYSSSDINPIGTLLDVP